MKQWIDTDWCPNCKEETEILYTSQEHERDSAYDTEECTKCGNMKMGLTGKWDKGDD